MPPLLTRRITSQYGGPMRVRTSHTLPPELHQRLRDLAARLPGASVSTIIETAVEMHLPHLEAAAAAYDAPEDQREEAVMEALLRSFMNTVREEEKDQAT